MSHILPFITAAPFNIQTIFSCVYSQKYIFGAGRGQKTLKVGFAAYRAACAWIRLRVRNSADLGGVVGIKSWADAVPSARVAETTSAAADSSFQRSSRSAEQYEVPTNDNK